VFYALKNNLKCLKIIIISSFLHALLSILMLGSSSAGAANSGKIDLTDMSLEELMDVEISSVARSPRKLLETPAAAFVITQEDIRRSGVTTIMDALRMAPGIQVAQIDGNKWAITARGFNARFANKLLVLMDGRTIYSPFFSGVIWEGQDIILEDIERIEIIRGPGAAIWGANAVNGIINIITKSARDTQGGMVTAGGGTHERAFGETRYGGKAGEDVYYRLFARVADRTGFDEVSGKEGNNDWKNQSAGFRLDWDPSGTDEMNFHGNIRTATLGQSYATPLLIPPYSEESRTDADGFGGYLLGRWSHRTSLDSEIALQLYYSRDQFDDINAEVMDDTIDIDFQHRFVPLEAHEITWGLAYRSVRTDTEDGLGVSFDPHKRRGDLFSAFLQDEIALVKDQVFLSMGAKFEHNDYTGTEIQPSARLRWDVNSSNLLWAAVSRAVRTPAVAEVDADLLVAVYPPMPPYSDYPTAVYKNGGNGIIHSDQLPIAEACPKSGGVSRDKTETFI
jgi:iron complex outermembrane recepter protein